MAATIVLMRSVESFDVAEMESNNWNISPNGLRRHDDRHGQAVTTQMAGRDYHLS